MKHKLTIIASGLLVLIIAGGAAGLYFTYHKHDAPIIYEDVITYELQTHEYFPNAPDDKRYHITSEDELHKFYSLYSNELAIDVSYLEKNDILIQVQPESSGSIQHKLEQVVIQNNKPTFQISTTAPEVTTADMSFWYYVAIIPKDKLASISLMDWKAPSEINH